MNTSRFRLSTKNYWNTHIKKKLKRMGIDPVTHGPIIDQAEGKPSKPALDEVTEESDARTSKKAILQAATEVSCRSIDSEITEEADKSIDSVKAVKLARSFTACNRLRVRSHAHAVRRKIIYNLLV